ncbi:winged helix-turn-helix domain-containing protein [Pedobacter sp. MC2016-15]|uniref:winged helix-turn-helix domain-containing protein n=1 Tax=Pedobacter sp. MC2016-15 TaxID=2994473 RepID=UPI002245CA3D|nr:winged helix-turn-helix domain-containing protein [Pedobacter sp. MC2016-15]MCX2477927.1 winged helix-turn-helix domain-containing protein [Pedobacter sp. MC2016-15]
MEIKLNGKLWIEADGKKVIGPGRIELLERIQACGSIRQAALQMSMSYRQAWQMIDDMNTRLEAPVVISQRGGKGGGNAVITEQGEQVIAEFKMFYKKFQQFLLKNSPAINLKSSN